MGKVQDDQEGTVGKNALLQYKNLNFVCLKGAQIMSMIGMYPLVQRNVHLVKQSLSDDCYISIL